MALTSHRVLTDADLAALPDDGNRYEIIGGVLIVTPAPTKKHQRLITRLLTLLYGHVIERGLGEDVYVAPFDVKLSARDVVQPDLLYVSPARSQIVSQQFVDGAPDLIVEILSPSTRQRDLHDKMQLYARYGVLEYWLVDPEARTLTILSRRDQEYVPVQAEERTVRSVVLPNLIVDVAALFANL